MPEIPLQEGPPPPSPLSLIARPEAASSASPASEGQGEERPAVRSKDNPTLALSDRFRAVVETVRQISPRHAASLSHGRLLAIRPGELVLAYAKSAEFHKTTVGGSGRATVEEALARHFGRPTQLVLESANSAAAASSSLAEEEAKERTARVKGADETVRNHPAVAAALRILGGELEHVQVLEPDQSPLLNPSEELADVDPSSPES